VALSASVLVVAVAVAAVALARSGRPVARPAATPSAGTSAPVTPSGRPTAGPASPSTPSTASALTLRQRAGQRVIYSYDGLTPPSSLIQHIRDGEVAGVIFFGENIASTAQIAAVVQQLRQAQQASPIRAPLLLMTDQEGGQVRRLPGPPTLSAKQIGESGNPPAQATAAGASAAVTLTDAGMNVNLAPVLDVFHTPGDFIDRYQRSYSGDPNTVAALGADVITAQQAGGVAATAKHFPGLGSATADQNTDTGPVTLTVELSRLRAIDEGPYPAAIAAGVTLVMLSWAVYPALDPDRPAGLSRTVVQSELRTRLHYTGVTISDALEAGALAAYGTPARRAILAAEAGVDLILCSARDVTQGENAVAGLADALSTGQLDPTSFAAALDRIDAIRSVLT
jgi:beta-N-acetylhexosaminidase